MVDFSSWLDLPLVWGFIIAIAVFFYVVLDGFDLGCGILFPFAPTDECRDRIMNSISPFWDGNETWLVMGGGGLLVAFPLAYSVLMPAFYLPIIFMLLGLIFRGVAFEFRFKASDRSRFLWDSAFHGGSLLAAFMQGIILGNFVQGVEVVGEHFSGKPFSWANGFSMVTAISIVFGYCLLGSTWLVMKTDKKTQEWARSVARYVLIHVGIAMTIISAIMPFLDERVFRLWLSVPNIYHLSLLPLLSAICFITLWQDLRKESREIRPFLLSLCLFLLSYIGFCISLFPWIVPFKFTLWQAAASSASLSIMLIGTVILLPIIFAYTAYSYYVFRGKSQSSTMYY